MLPNVTPIKIAYEHGKKCVVSPRGTMNKEALKYSSLKKKIFYFLFQKNVLNKVDLIHATSQSELKDIREFGIDKPVTVIPNGVDIPILKYKKHSTKFKLIYLGRIHPKKGIDNAIQAWASIESKYPYWVFEIAGVGNKKYENQIKKLILNTKSKSIQFLGPLYGDNKQKFIQSADILIMPSYNENFGMVAAEALSNNTPVICGENTPWEEVVKKKCGWSIPNDSKNIEKTLNKALRMSKRELFHMGHKGRLWMKKEYSWDQLAYKMILSYQWLISKKNKPSWIYLSK